MQFEINKSILIVDDNLADSYLLQKTLHKLGVFNVESVSTAENAAKYIVGLPPFAHRYEPAAIFIDLGLPNMGALELVAWLSKNPIYSAMPLIVCSDSSNPMDRETALSAGAHAFYRKSAEAEKLGAVLEEIMGLLPGCQRPGADSLRG